MAKEDDRRDRIRKLAQEKGQQGNKNLARIWNLIERFEDDELAEDIEELLESYPAPPVFEDGFYEYPFGPMPDEGISGYVVGKDHRTGKDLCIDDPIKNVLCSGPIGQGKTNSNLNFIKSYNDNGVTVFVFQNRKGDYDFLLDTELHERVILIPIKRLRLQVLYPPPGVNWPTWSSKIISSFGHTFELFLASRYAMGNSLQLWYRKYYEPYARFPSFGEYADYARNDVSVSGWEKRYYDTFLQRVEEISINHNEIFDVEIGHDIAVLSSSGKIVIFDMGDLDQQASQWIIMVLIHWIYKFREHSEQHHEMVAFLIEEARNLLKPKDPQFYVEDLNLLVSMCRPFNMSFIFADQLVSMIDDTITSLTKYKLFYGCQSKEIDAAMKVAGLSKEQAEYLRRCRVGQAVVRIDDYRFPEPFTIHSDKFPFEPERKTPWGKLLKMAEPALKNLDRDIVPRLRLKKADTTTPKISTRPSTLGENEAELLKAIAKHPAQLRKDYQRILGWTDHKISTAIKYLHNKGFIMELNPATGKPGKAKLFELTGLARNWLYEQKAQFGRTPKGGVIHAFWVFKAQEFLKKEGFKTELEYRFDQNVSSDIFAMKEGCKVVVEIDCHYHGLENFEKYARWLDSLDEIILAVDDQSADRNSTTQEKGGFFESVLRKIDRLNARERGKVKIVRCQEWLADFV